MAIQPTFFESPPSPTFVLDLRDNTPIGTGTLTVNFTLDENTLLPSIQDEFGNPYSGTTSIQVNINSSTTTLTNNSFVVQAGGASRTYVMQAGETTDFTISWYSNQFLGIEYSFLPDNILPPSWIGGSDILGKVTVLSPIFEDSSRNFSEGQFKENPSTLSVSTDENLLNDYILNITVKQFLQNP